MSKGIPSDLMAMLAAADKRNNLPAGTMHAILQQETGGNAKYLNDPAAYHYEADASGRRIAKHTGQVSTAFGPFGILESTGAQPGYGVAPLKDKSWDEQLRFASDYVAARAKNAGGLEAGLAGYGEGKKYSQQVMTRIGQGAAGEPVVVSAPVEQGGEPVVVAQAPVQLAQVTPQQVGYVAPQAGSWEAFQQAAPKSITPKDLEFNAGPQRSINAMDYINQPSAQVNFNQFKPRRARV